MLSSLKQYDMQHAYHVMQVGMDIGRDFSRGGPKVVKFHFSNSKLRGKYFSTKKPGCGVGAARSWRFLGVVGFLRTLGVGVGFFIRLQKPS